MSYVYIVTCVVSLSQMLCALSHVLRVYCHVLWAHCHHVRAVCTVTWVACTLSHVFVHCIWVTCTLSHVSCVQSHVLCAHCHMCCVHCIVLCVYCHICSVHCHMSACTLSRVGCTLSHVLRVHCRLCRVYNVSRVVCYRDIVGVTAAIISIDTTSDEDGGPSGSQLCSPDDEDCDVSRAAARRGREDRWRPLPTPRRPLPPPMTSSTYTGSMTSRGSDRQHNNVIIDDQLDINRKALRLVTKWRHHRRRNIIRPTTQSRRHFRWTDLRTKPTNIGRRRLPRVRNPGPTRRYRRSWRSGGGGWGGWGSDGTDDQGVRERVQEHGPSTVDERDPPDDDEHRTHPRHHRRIGLAPRHARLRRLPMPHRKSEADERQRDVGVRWKEESLLLRGGLGPEHLPSSYDQTAATRPRSSTSHQSTASRRMSRNVRLIVEHVPMLCLMLRYGRHIWCDLRHKSAISVTMRSYTSQIVWSTSRIPRTTVANFVINVRLCVLRQELWIYVTNCCVLRHKLHDLRHELYDLHRLYYVDHVYLVVHCTTSSVFCVTRCAVHTRLWRESTPYTNYAKCTMSNKICYHINHPIHKHVRMLTSLYNTQNNYYDLSSSSRDCLQI